jgi:hypothetical protein
LTSFQEFAIIEAVHKRTGKFSMVIPGKGAEIGFFSGGRHETQYHTSVGSLGQNPGEHEEGGNAMVEDSGLLLLHSYHFDGSAYPSTIYACIFPYSMGDRKIPMGKTPMVYTRQPCTPKSTATRKPRLERANEGNREYVEGSPGVFQILIFPSFPLSLFFTSGLRDF